MLYNQVSDIIDELETMNGEKKFADNLKFIAYSYDYIKLNDIRKYLLLVNERIYQLIDREEVSYSLYIVYMVCLFFYEAKKYNPRIFDDNEIFKLITLLFHYIEQILRKKECQTSLELSSKKEEILALIRTQFKLEFYYRKKSRFEKLLERQFELPL